MSSIRLNAIAIDNTPLLIEKGTVYISHTKPSTSTLTGALTLDGGIGINCTQDAISSTCGGALTIAGGLSVESKTYLGSNVVLDSYLSTFKVNGITYDRFFLDNVNNKNLYISLDGLNQHILFTPENFMLHVTKGSTNSSTGSFVSFGGISINNTENSISTTQGGALTVAGGLSVEKDVFFGNNMYLENTLNVENIVADSLFVENTQSLQITSDNISLSSNTFSYNDKFTFENDLFNITSPIEFNNTTSNSITTYGDIHMYSTTESINNSTGSLTIAGGVGIEKDVFIGGDVSIDGVLSLKNTSISNNTGNLVFDSNSGFIFNDNSVSINSGIIELNTYELTASSTNLNIQSLLGNTNLNMFTLLGDTTENNIVNIYAKGTPTSLTNTELLQLGFDKDSQNFKLNVKKNGSGILRDLTLSNTNGYLTLLSTGSVNISNTLTLLSDMYINSTNNAVSSTQGGAMTILGGLGVDKDCYVNGRIYVPSVSTSNLFSINMSTANLNTSQHITIPTSKMLSIDPSDYFIYSNNTVGYYSLGWYDDVSTNDGPMGYLAGYGGIRFFSQSTPRMTIVSSGRVGINTTSPNYILDINGTASANEITCSNIQISGTISTGTFSCNNNSTVNGILYAKNNTNAINTLTGSIIVDGGISIKKDLYMNGLFTCNTKGNFSDLVLSNSLNVSGKVYFNNTSLATNVTTGGCLTLAGGLSVFGNSYFNQECNLYNKINIKNVNDFINLYDSNNVLRFTVSHDTNLAFDRYNASSNFVEHVLTITNADGLTLFGNETPSLSNSASVILAGGLRINCVQDTFNDSNGGALTVVGGMSVGKKSIFAGNMRISSATESSDYVTGALIVDGGVGITKNLNVGGNINITGDLYVSGSTFTVNSENVTLNDNILLLNSGPSNSHDAGILVQRYQTDNNSGTGDVVNDTPVVIDTLPIQTGIASNMIKLSGSTSSINNYYNNWWIKVQSGFSINQTRQIISYNGTTRVATLSSAWNTQNPAGNDTVYLYNKPFVGFIYNELLNKFELGSTVNDPGETYVSFTDTLGLVANDITLNSTTASLNSTTGSLLLLGGLSIDNAENATSNTHGGCITVAGGASINKSLYVGQQLYVNNVDVTPNSYDIPSTVTFNPLNNTLDTTFLTINHNVLSFDIFLGCSIQMSDSNDNMYCNFHIRGINKTTSWEIVTDYVGDDTGIEFDIVHDITTSNGFLQYSTPDYGPTIINIIFKYKMTTN